MYSLSQQLCNLSYESVKLYRLPWSDLLHPRTAPTCWHSLFSGISTPSHFCCLVSCVNPAKEGYLAAIQVKHDTNVGDVAMRQSPHLQVSHLRSRQLASGEIRAIHEQLLLCK